MAPGLNAIPSHVVGYVGGNISKSSYALWKDGQLVVLYAESDSSESPAYDDMVAHHELRKSFLNRLEIIQTMLRSIRFQGGITAAYFIPHGRSYKIVDASARKREKMFNNTIPCVPDIYEHEIQTIRWVSADFRVARWKGREVDINYAWDDDELERVKDSMSNYNALKALGLDFTYEVLGVLRLEDDSIAGLVTEPQCGTLPKSGDRTLVYDAFAKLQAAGFLCRALGTYSVHIHQGKVRIANLARGALYLFPKDKPEQFDKETERNHWNALKEYFDEVKDDHTVQYGPRSFEFDTIVLPETPYPEFLRSLSIVISITVPQSSEELERLQREHKRKSKKAIASRRNKGHTNNFILPTESETFLAAATITRNSITFDRPLRGDVIHPTYPRLHIFHPYQPCKHSPKASAVHDISDNTSESGLSSI
ncbi:hypothetical protein BDQ12DRAFT_736910 [Crucibulum laeve]|uniref:Uncharacterized protein n=1 Tax=Crucibulum laeve TaxID=68775 RepID=A0A5C3LW39_9AGAR|nr:hypothetical protein BDQ12DRAFT_736910 [Crucibulum laeve]